MYPSPQTELDAIDTLQRAKNFLENYLTNREAAITDKERQIAQLRKHCEENFLRLKKLQNFSADFFENRRRINSLAMRALDRAIELGDENVAAVALAIIDDEYSKDFFGAMNQIGGIIR